MVQKRTISQKKYLNVTNLEYFIKLVAKYPKIGNVRGANFDEEYFLQFRGKWKLKKFAFLIITL